MPADFIHLHVHSEYSLVDSTIRIDRLVAACAQAGMPAVALTDQVNLFALVKFYTEAEKAGIKPIAGSDIWIADAADRNKPHRLTLLCQDLEGYRNLSRLLSRAWADGRHGDFALVEAEWLFEANRGLIVLAGRESDVGAMLLGGREDLARAHMAEWMRHFPDRYYFELVRTQRADEEAFIAAAVELAIALDLPAVASNDVRFLDREDFEAHEARVCIHEGRVLADPKRPRHYSAEQYLKSPAQMIELFADLPQAIENTVELARRCNLELSFGTYYLPDFPIPPGFTLDSWTRTQARNGLAARLARQAPAPGFSVEDYQGRLETEVDVIVAMGFPGYFLIVADFIQWAKAHDIPVGPGRGSGAGSLVAYALTITDLDPLRYDLLFERFLNPDRVSMPDFDVDFCQDRRGEVIDYVQQKYGENQVAQIITFGSLQAKAVVRDVGRVLQMPYGQVDRISKLIPANPANPVSLAQALDMEPQLKAMRDGDEQVKELIAIAQKLEGLYRHASTHAAGIVIGERPLTELVPMYRDPRSDMPVTQYSLKWVEPAGLVKFDFLGLTTLTVLQKAVEMINRNGTKFALTDIPIDDKQTFDNLTKGDVVGVFQVESPGMRRALVDMRPDRFEDLIALVALYRPGPMANIPTYCARKRGEEEVEYLHPLLQPILEPTYGVITYQEQVQQIAKSLAGYTLAEADLLRRAMGKKIKAEMDAQRERFLKGAEEQNGIPRALANTIFDACAKFAEYGFNKSHSAPYGYITYQTAYLKTHFFQEFMAASMTYVMSNTDKLNEFREDAKKHGIEIIAPSVNTSDAVFTARDGKIFYAIGAIKGVGQAVAEHIVEARGTTPFRDLADFATRVDPRIINKRTLETLINAGAFDCLHPRREQVFASIDAIVATAQRTAANASDGIMDMFASDEPEPIRLTANVAPWGLAERLERERAAIGFHISAHPLDDYAGLFESMKIMPFVRFEHGVKEGDLSAGRLAGTIASRADRRTKKGTPMMMLSLSDPSGSFEVIGFSEAVEQYGRVLQPGASVILNVEADERPDGISLRLMSAVPIDEAAQKAGKTLKIETSDAKCLVAIKSQLKPGGNGRITFVVMRDQGRKLYEVDIGANWQINPALAGAIKSFDGVVDVRLN